MRSESVLPVCLRMSIWQRLPVVRNGGIGAMCQTSWWNAESSASDGQDAEYRGTFDDDFAMFGRPAQSPQSLPSILPALTVAAGCRWTPASGLVRSARRSNANTTSRRWAAVNSDRLSIDSSFPVRTIQLYPKEASLSTFPNNPTIYIRTKAHTFGSGGRRFRAASRRKRNR
jgi:hypothetical protein